MHAFQSNCHPASQVVLLEEEEVQLLCEDLDDQVVVEAESVDPQPSLQQVEVRQHPSDRLVGAANLVLDERYLSTARPEG